MQYIVNFSAGLTSWEALRRTIDRHGKEHTVAVMADVLTEDADSYRFLHDTEHYFGIPIALVADGRTPFDVWRAKRAITINGAAQCSKVLKRDVLDRWVAEQQFDAYTIVTGLDWSEVDRMIRLRERYAPTPVWFPLAEPPYMDKCHIADYLEQIGITVPALYHEGFTHNNCGGGCVKAGQAHWARLWRARPETYARWEREEADFIAWIGKTATILKDRRGDGPGRPMTLQAFRERLERGEAYDKDDWGGCGCFAPVVQGRMDSLLLEADVRQ